VGVGDRGEGAMGRLSSLHEEANTPGHVGGQHQGEERRCGNGHGLAEPKIRWCNVGSLRGHGHTDDGGQPSVVASGADTELRAVQVGASGLSVETVIADDGRLPRYRHR
jgi:hypothetical protein